MVLLRGLCVLFSEVTRALPPSPGQSPQQHLTMLLRAVKVGTLLSILLLDLRLVPHIAERQRYHALPWVCLATTLSFSGLCFSSV